ncbi:DUF6879 family protein [Streptomyces millisiae]|uniref:DUF6879 domain-containing protein n=1 Tax=Streptomyces millisiae TaxID=3075542 RepID=A0ABU2LQI8_9ACTN|nr:DUF6879 family protein [Streptomyces sp. DSM 44918]MDT0319533.1 hypothetical protein [Streptomyces sp. DSM 44918]
MPRNVPGFDELLDSATRRAAHLELRDHYGVDEERQMVSAWRANGAVPAYDSEFWRPWVSLVERTVARGVQVRRARVVSQPVTEYIRFEHAITDVNLRAGEQVRWLSRRQACDLALPGNDFWLIDDKVVRFNIFSGDGAALEPEMSEDASVIKLCADAFDAVWERGVPHTEFTV